MAVSPIENTDGPVGVTIKTDGTAIPDTMILESVITRKEIGRIPEATVTFQSGDIPASDFSEVDGDVFKLGKEVEISAFYGDHPVTVIFRGMVFGKRLRISSDSGSQMVLTLRDKAQTMNVTAANGQYLAQKDSDIMQSLIADAGLTANVTGTTPAARDQMRHNCTAWEFLRALADRNGHVIVADDGEIKVGKPGITGAAAMTLTLGVDIFTFDAAADTQYLFKTAGGVSWDDSAQTTVQGDGGTGAASKWGNVSLAQMTGVAGAAQHAFATNATHAKDEMDAISRARLNRTAQSALRGRVSFQGYGAIKPDDTVEVGGVGQAFGGIAYVGAVQHDISAGTWRTELSLGLPEGWRTDDGAFGGAAASGLSTPVHGLQIAKVVKLTDDPDGRLRIQVSLPVHGAEETLVWARYATPYATTAAGVFFLPEPDDEVVLGYLDSDPDSPVVLGVLHNGLTAQPYTPDDENTYKAIVTKNNLKIEFEDVKKIITISTPGGHTVTMDDDATEVTIKDSTGNKMQMTSSGIDMTSPGDINITADGSVKITATGDASVEGLNVDVTAQAQMTASGNAGAELSSSGQTVVQGSIVMIN